MYHVVKISSFSREQGYADEYILRRSLQLVFWGSYPLSNKCSALVESLGFIVLTEPFTHLTTCLLYVIYLTIASTPMINPTFIFIRYLISIIAKYILNRHKIILVLATSSFPGGSVHFNLLLRSTYSPLMRF
mgnify:CR=1 FL=1